MSIWVRVDVFSAIGALAVFATPQSKKSNQNATLTGCLDEQRLSSESEPMLMRVQTIKALSGACTPLELAVVNLARSANPIARN
jgi:hypothetical protein